MSRNYVMEKEIIELLEEYRKNRFPDKRSWSDIARDSGMSRRVIYDIMHSENSVRKQSVISLGLTLHMSLKDFNFLFQYKGYSLRPFDNSEKKVIDLLSDNDDELPATA